MFILLCYSQCKLTVEWSFCQLQMLFTFVQVLDSLRFLFFTTLGLSKSSLFFTLHLHKKSKLLLKFNFLYLVYLLSIALASSRFIGPIRWCFRWSSVFLHHNLILLHNICTLRSQQFSLLMFCQLWNTTFLFRFTVNLSLWVILKQRFEETTFVFGLWFLW
jgi:hypothetical protein